MPLVRCRISVDIDMGATPLAGFEGFPGSNEVTLEAIVGTTAVFYYPVGHGETIKMYISVIAEDAEAGEVVENTAYLDLQAQEPSSNAGNEGLDNDGGSVVGHAGDIGNEEDERPLDDTQAAPQSFFVRLSEEEAAILFQAAEAAIERRSQSRRVQEDTRRANPWEFEEKDDLTTTNALFHEEEVFVPKETQFDIGSIDDSSE